MTRHCRLGASSHVSCTVTLRYNLMSEAVALGQDLELEGVRDIVVAYGGFGGWGATRVLPNSWTIMANPVPVG
jgi:hypothetical protein